MNRRAFVIVVLLVTQSVFTVFWLNREAVECEEARGDVRVRKLALAHEPQRCMQNATGADDGCFRSSLEEPLLCVVFLSDVLEVEFLTSTLLATFPGAVRTRFDYQFEQVSTCTLTLIVYSVLYNTDFEAVVQYMRKQRDTVSRLGVFVLSDEFCQQNIDPLVPLVDFGFRNYWCPEMYPYTDRLMWLPLGYVSGFVVPAASQVIPASQRRIPCYFSGSTKQERIDLFDLLSPRHYDCELRLSDNFNTGLPKSRYRADLLDSAIALCPRGMNSEQFRIWESLACGCIPIMQSGWTWEKLPRDHPLLIVDELQKYDDLIGELLNNSTKMDLLQRKTYAWYLEFIKDLQQKVITRIIG